MHTPAEMLQTAAARSHIELNPHWVVLKFGGTSVSKKARWNTIAGLIDGELKARRVLVVVSALSGVTDKLKQLAELNLLPQAQAQMVQSIAEQHLALLAELQINAALPECQNAFEQLMSALAKHLSLRPSEADFALSGALYAWQAELLSFGELLSSTLGAHYLSALGLPVAWLDARLHLKASPRTSDSEWAHYLSAQCESQPSALLQRELAERSPAFITQGFIARNSKSQTVLLGRGGSDTSAGYFGALLAAQEVQIWTDVPGMFSANPKRVPDARLLQRLDFDEAQEMAATGAKVLHPRCLIPLREAEISLRIKDTDRPLLGGTLIGPVSTASLPSVKAVSIRTGITLVSMESLGMWQQVGFLADVFGFFKKHGLSIDLIGSSETNVTVSLDPSENLLNADVLQRLCEDLAAVCKVKVIAPCAALTLVGRGIRSLLHRLSQVCAEVGAGRVHLLTQSSNDLNLTFVIDEDRADALLPAVHQSLLSERLLPLDEADVLGPSWAQLHQTQPGSAHAAQPNAWWKAARAQLTALAKTGPIYACALPVVAERALELRAMDAVDEWFYAIKANSAAPILSTLLDAGFGLECVSLAEIEHVQRAFPALDAAHILFSPNFAPRAEYQAAIDKGVQLTLDSIFALKQWSETMRGQRIQLRLDLGFGGGHHAKVNTGGERSKFGLALMDLPEFTKLARELDVQIIGLHAHLGSGISDIAHWPRVFSELASIAERVPSVQTLNLGGGLAVPHTDTDARIDLIALNQRLLALRALYPHLRVRMEPGRYPVAESTVLLCRVTQVKSKGKGRFVGVDTGMNSLIRPALYDAYHEIVNLSSLDGALIDAPCTIVGPICETGDVLGLMRKLPECLEGDVILIAEAGAYGAAMASHYNLRAPAKEVFLSTLDTQESA